jgi:bisphosphoglycerate-independent phosphoglycerate mutase (AlkP superfamily)
MSLFHSVDPWRHGVTTNVYTPQVRPIKGLCEVILDNRKKSAFFYNWEELRDLSRPNCLVFSYFCKGDDIGYRKANDIVSDAAIDYLKENWVDFAFLYLGYPDAAGHKYGWMSDEYMEAIKNSWENINRVTAALPDDYTVIITADHGGHDRMHGTEAPEDMTIPIMITGKGIEAGKVLQDANIKDIAPTIVKLLSVEPDEEWEGASLL